ncbi:MAG: hypothetical protein WCK35_14980 [Chloroflexota bacterium]
MDTNKLDFHLSDSEQIIRQYECTRLPHLFAKTTFGYLTVTNKRIVYHSQSKTFSDSSTVLSEIPLDDVSGLSTSISASFNWLFFLIFSFCLYMLVTLAVIVFPPFLIGWVMAILLLLPSSISFLFEKNILSEDAKHQLLRNLQDLPGGDRLTSYDRDFYERIYNTLFYVGLVMLAWNVAFRTEFFQSFPAILKYLLLGVVFFLIFRATFGQAKTFSLMISSKAASGSGIYIPGNPLNLLFGGGNNALQSFVASPGLHAETIVAELGAMLTDIRQLGDLGIQKWQK